MGDCSSGNPKDHIDHNRKVLAEAIRLFTDSYWKQVAFGRGAAGIRIPIQRHKAGNIRLIPEEEHAG